MFTTINYRINARAHVVSSRAIAAEIVAGVHIENAPLVLVSVLVEGMELQAFAVANHRREYDADRRQYYTAYAKGPMNKFLGRFSAATRQQAQQMQLNYWFL